jgi:hypothetical protein
MQAVDSSREEATSLSKDARGPDVARYSHSDGCDHC